MSSLPKPPSTPPPPAGARGLASPNAAHGGRTGHGGVSSYAAQLLTPALLEELDSVFDVFDQQQPHYERLMQPSADTAAVIASAAAALTANVSHHGSTTRGRMACSDLPVALQLLGVDVSREQAQTFQTLYSGDGKSFTRSEFFEIAGELIASRPATAKQQLLEEAFLMFDSHGSGSVSAKNLQRVLQRTSAALEAAELGGLDGLDDDDMAALVRDLDAEKLGLTKAAFVELLMKSSSIV